MPILQRKVASSKQVRYATDERFRVKAKEISRNGYRKKVGMETQNCLYSLEFIDNIAKDFVVRRNDGKKPAGTLTVQGFSVPDAADALQQLYQTVWRWIQNGIIPAPIFERVGEGGKRPYLVYHLEEVRILVEEIGEHEKSMAYLRKDHVETRGRIERRFNQFRKALKF